MALTQPITRTVRTPLAQIDTRSPEVQRKLARVIDLPAGRTTKAATFNSAL